MTTYPFHPLADLFPLIEGKDFDEFCAGLKSDGRLHDKIVLFEGKILDGRNRQRGCDATGITAHYRTFDPAAEGTPLSFVIAKNLHRRHLNESQRAMVAARLADMPSHRPDDKSANLRTSQEAAASLVNVSQRSVVSAKAVQEHGEPELVRAVDRGKLPVSAAAQAVKLDPAQQRRVAEEAEAGRANVARSVLKQGARQSREHDLADKQRALPDKQYGVILADPEWRFEPYSRETGMDRAADNHYPTSETVDICARPVGTIAAPDSALFLWATAPMLKAALAVMEHWGFTYKSQCVWVKDRAGTGYWFRNTHEILLVGTRGNVPAPAMGTQAPSAIAEPVGKHSEKPEAFYRLIESYFPNLPKIELNARTHRSGWDAWGLEAPPAIDGLTAAERSLAEQLVALHEQKPLDLNPRLFVFGLLDPCRTDPLKVSEREYLARLADKLLPA